MTFTILASLALTTAGTSATALGTFNSVVLDEMVIARMHAVAQTATPLMKHRFANIFRGNGYGLAAVDVSHRTLINGLGDRLFNLRFITA
ncbi:hypothetical protein VEE15_04560 [Escherichia coli]|nr:hypothetical protein VEE15_04560 [Escherichia coli]